MQTQTPVSNGPTKEYLLAQLAAPD